MIGFRVRGDHFNFEGFDSNPEFEEIPAVAQCLADRTGGLYVSTETMEELDQALRRTLGCPLFSAMQ